MNGSTRCIDGPIASELTSLVARLDEHARTDSLGQKLLQLTHPACPTSTRAPNLADDSLVDPDNRRPVDFGARREALATLSDAKIRVVTAALRLRRERPHVFTNGAYAPLLAEGPAAGHLVAFVRGSDVVTAVTRHSVRLAETGWGDTFLTLPDGTWEDRIGSGRFSGRVSAVELVRGVFRSPCWSGSMTEFAVWAPRPERVRLDVDGTLHPMTRADDELVARRRRRRAGRAIRVRARRRPEGAARPSIAAPARRCARAVAAVGACSRRLDRRRLAGPLDRGPRDLRTPHRHIHTRRAHSTPRSRSWTIWSISASTSSR